MSLSDIKSLSIGSVGLKQLSANGITVWKAPIGNLVPTSIDTDGSIYNGCGYLDGWRLSSSGALKTQNGSTVSGFIPAKGGDVIRIAGVKWYNTEITINYLCAYDSSFNYIGALYSMSGGRSYGTIIWDSLESFGETDAVVRLKPLVSIAYIRVSSATDYIQTGETMIVTVNEEIIG